EILRVPGEPLVGSAQEPQLREGARRINISDLVEPISANTNLQALALDQVRFPKPLPLQTLVAYSDSGAVVDLTRRVNKAGVLDWTAPTGNWTLYALFQGWHGKMVERAGPGGEGNVIDHFDATALRHYLKRFDQAFAGRDVRPLRGFFNDSYEVDDASGQADWTPRLFDEFRKRRGYDLRQHLPALLGKDSADKNARVLCDYRETVSDLLLQNFTEEWRKWSHRQRAIIRNQAHGSPANILDLYAAIDIPETEGTEILRIKFATSAAHVTGKKLVSSESATWLNEHFRSTLWDVKQSLDRYFLGGVNHIFYHGTCYSPQNEPWPGWLFYAAVHFSPRNSWWNDFAAINEYVTRVQSFLQSGKADNDVLLYFPIADFYSERGNALLRHFDGVPRGSRLQATAETLQSRGYAFDFISDRQLQNMKASPAGLHSGGVIYRTVVIPECRYLPLETFEKLIDLAKGGARIVFIGKLPDDVAGFGRLEQRQEKFQKLTKALKFGSADSGQVQQATIGRGAMLISGNLENALTAAGASRETMVDSGLQFFRGNRPEGVYYFIANRSQTNFEGWITLETRANQAALFDAMHGDKGLLPARKSSDGKLQVHLQFAPGESGVVQTLKQSNPSYSTYTFHEPSGTSHELTGTWNLKFISGGPELPKPAQLTQLGSWTDSAGEAGQRFSGTAEYSLRFSAGPGDASGFWLDLGRV
ncbi:MAG: glycoside hydrolase family 2 protein, partial [Akkermansiaceae bacterium]|nr:glycoside hydrolase family 2 protein [Verrucomicrobiales bacterium]